MTKLELLLTNYPHLNEMCDTKTGIPAPDWIGEYVYDKYRGSDEIHSTFYWLLHGITPAKVDVLYRYLPINYNNPTELESFSLSELRLFGEFINHIPQSRTTHILNRLIVLYNSLKMDFEVLSRLLPLKKSLVPNIVGPILWMAGFPLIDEIDMLKFTLTESENLYSKIVEDTYGKLDKVYLYGDVISTDIINPYFEVLSYLKGRPLDYGELVLQIHQDIWLFDYIQSSRLTTSSLKYLMIHYLIDSEGLQSYLELNLTEDELLQLHKTQVEINLVTHVDGIKNGSLLFIATPFIMTRLQILYGEYTREEYLERLERLLPILTRGVN